jgi:hypothetical protein
MRGMELIGARVSALIPAPRLGAGPTSAESGTNFARQHRDDDEGSLVRINPRS